jgi:L-lactate dehydrogenase complex protein LldG
MTASSRELILRRISRALTDVPDGESPEEIEVPRAYRESHAAGDLVELFIERVADYRAQVTRTTAAELPETVATMLTGRGVKALLVPHGFPEAALATPALRGVDLLADRPALSAEQIEAVDGVLTTAALGVAVTGTIVLDAGPGQGRRALTLLPDYHLCVIHADQIAADVPEALRRLDPRRPLTMISGPSATSDIENDRVEGVHGPRTLQVIVVDEHHN